MVLYNATAVTEINGTGVCVNRRADSPQDLCVAVAQVSSRRLAVQVYCVPQAPGLSVYLVSSGVSGIGPFVLPGDLMSCSFVDSGGTTLGLLIREDNLDVAYLMTSRGVTALPPFKPLIPNGKALVRVVSMWAIEDGLVVDAVVRGFQDTSVVSSMMNFRSGALECPRCVRGSDARVPQVRAPGQRVALAFIPDRPLAVRAPVLVHTAPERAVPAAPEDPRATRVHSRVRVCRRGTRGHELGPAGQPVPVLVSGRAQRGPRV